jgi:hypothetical protein
MTDFSAARISDQARTAMGGARDQRRAAAASAAGPAGGGPGEAAGRVVVQGRVTAGDPPLEAPLRVAVERDLDPPAVAKGVRDHPVQAVRSEAMKIPYDAATDPLTVVLRDAAARTSEEEKSGVILDYHVAGRLIALEILDASARFDRVDTVQLQVVPRPAAAE